MYTLIGTAKLDDVDPQAWLADVLARLPDLPARRIHELLPYNWSPAVHRMCPWLATQPDDRAAGGRIAAAERLDGVAEAAIAGLPLRRHTRRTATAGSM